LYGIKCADVNECNAHCPSIIMKLPTTFIIVFGGEKHTGGSRIQANCFFLLIVLFENLNAYFHYSDPK
jgi:hypothetical protein